MHESFKFSEIQKKLSYRENEHYAKQICVHLIRLIMTIPKICKLLMIGAFWEELRSEIWKIGPDTKI